MKRTTILADEELLLQIRQLAYQQRSTVTHVIKEALAEYLVRHAPAKRHLSITGIGRSGKTDISERADEILKDEVGQYGWAKSPRKTQ